jgi:hypothetical protein
MNANPEIFHNDKINIPDENSSFITKSNHSRLVKYRLLIGEDSSNEPSSPLLPPSETEKED